MNYKIKITAENQAIVKRIADENGMNPSNFQFFLTEKFYIIKNNLFYVGNVDYEENIFLDYTEITTEQFIKLFDKKETELDKWLNETKAKNLSLEKLRDEVNFLDTKFYKQVRKELKVVGTLYQHLFNLWNNPQESPKVETEPRKIIGYKTPCDLWKGDIKQGQIYTVMQSNKQFYKPDGRNYISNYCINKEIVEKLFEPVFEPLPTEQPKETDFKTKVIELIEKRIEKRTQDLEQAVANKAYMTASTIEVVITIQKDLLNQIKQL